MVKPLATASSRAASIGRPPMFGPSPDTSITLRVPSMAFPSASPTEKSMAFEMEFQPTAQRYEYGTQNDALFYGLAEAIGFITAVGIDRIRDHNRRLSERFRGGLLEIPGAEVLSPAEEEYRSAMITFRLEGTPYREITAGLGRQGYRVRPVGEVGLDAVRVSFHLYNHEAEVDGALEEIRAIAG